MYIALKSARKTLRNPLVSFIFYPILIHWLFFSAFPAALDGGAAQGAIVFTLCLLAVTVLGLKILLIPVSALARLETYIVARFNLYKPNYTPVRLRFA